MICPHDHGHVLGTYHQGNALHVEKAIEAFGTGFLAHKANDRLREAFESGDLDKQDYYRQLLRLYKRVSDQ